MLNIVPKIINYFYMHQRHSKLFESGGETVKRNLLESYSMQNRKPNSNEDQ